MVLGVQGTLMPNEHNLHLLLTICTFPFSTFHTLPQEENPNMFFRLFVASFILFAAQAYPTFTGNCKSGNSLGGSHLKSASKGALSAYGLVLKIGGKTVSPGTAFKITKGASLAITLSGSKTFKGFQIRIGNGSASTLGYLKKGTAANVVTDAQCTNIKIGGISHNNATPKTSVQGIISVPIAKNGLTLEVTVVVSNGSTSTWYRSAYTLNSV